MSISHQRATGLRDELRRNIAELDDLKRSVASGDGDANEVREAANRIALRNAEISGELATVTDHQRQENTNAALNRTMGFPRAEGNRIEVPSFGEQIKTRALASLGRDMGAEDDLNRVLAHGVSADGTAPVTIEGDLIKFVDSNRYAVNAARKLPMPDNRAATFKRPRVSQTTLVSQQVNEGDVLASQRLQVTGDTITKLTRGGVLALSEQETDWTEPALLEAAVYDLAQQYAIDSDKVLTAAIEAAAPEATETVLSLTATLAQFVAAVTAASAAVYATAKRLPDTLYVAVDRWAYIAGLADTTGRPAFPIAGPYDVAGVNTGGIASFTGMNVLGLNVCVDPNFSANVMIVGASSLVEFYEQNKGLLQIAAPSTLETTIAYRGYVAANVYTQGLNGIEVA